jgi:hypothetical protein
MLVKPPPTPMLLEKPLVVAEPLPCENAPLTELLTESCFSPRLQTAHDAVVQRHSYR